MEENFRVGVAEAVNRLLNVTDGEKVVGADDFADNFFLHAVGILILVDHDDAEFFAVSGGGSGIGVENFECEVFHVVEVDDIFVAFGGGEGGVEIERDFDELAD